MEHLDSTRLNYGGNQTVAENGNNRSRTTTDRQPSDGVALDARPTYERAYDSLLTLAEAGDEQLRADGGTETVEYTVYRCGGCARVFADQDKVVSTVIDGETTTYDEPRCPHCGTPVTDEHTATTTAEFELPAHEVPRQ